MSIDKADVPPISTVMGLRRKSNVNYPLKTTVDPGKYELLSATQKYEQSLFGEPVLTAHVRQRKFPVTSEDLVYPEASRMGATNPLYALASQDIGNEPPKAHQMPGRYFPRSTKFSSAFTTSNPRDTGLNTSISWSKVHPTLDQMY
uniref:Uncharacterized protein n=1 Tax=Chromera velia CCMP2878 TaxID=1169474 RepID=A0A0G4F374_9ALVE|eukprot:Cvel_14824.t1-p1 / transcript=Cvel_14824.t1 / gene=Cvel_14824 / organism=Chromera_velia_CCMP2878 / gene_product=hypothetical protein / transcript_product=hypothetical protein / location=Cvel_scaffold1070:1663-2866(+) / protein_length=145 / sequence_SO=supercontig / SO=protein_coding / is_pseudo=false